MSAQSAENARALLRRLAEDPEAVERVRQTLLGIDGGTAAPERIRAALMNAAKEADRG